ncbi:hypothetical protein ACFYS7_38390 [Streptomyces avermitilis]|uniref:hypothetical protein n=1 Tax=Streptomyces avermitilis TaxID=33903 RepID=UPI0036A88708
MRISCAQASAGRPGGVLPLRTTTRTPASRAAQCRPDILRAAVALSAAAVPCPAVGDVDAAVYPRFLTEVSVEEARPAPSLTSGPRPDPP